MIPVLIESRFAGDIAKHKAYCRAAMRDCLSRGEAPFASHMLYTQPGVLNDADAKERQLGIEAGLLWGTFAQKTVVYVDCGISHGMEYGIARAALENRPVEYRSIVGWTYTPTTESWDW